MVPVVLHHGLFGYDEIRLGRWRIPYFLGIDRAIRERGHPLIVPRVHPCGSTARRAGQLKQIILDQLPMISRPNRTDRRVVIIAHSLGGLDARYMLSKLDMADHVAALVTITTPHRGSPYADWCMRHFGHRLGGLKLMALLGIDVEGIVDLTAERCQRFNQTIQDVPGVRYFSVSAVQAWNKVPTFARHAHKTVYEAEGDNDSLVSVQSSTWATHLGVWPADHWHTINRRHGRGANRTADIAPYYLGVLDQLRERGVWN